MPKVLSHKERILKKVGKRPQNATVIANKLGHSTHHAVAKDLGALAKEGKVVKTDKGYVRK